MKIELHAHPFFENYGLGDVINAMDKNKIHAAGLSALDFNLFDEVYKQSTKLSKDYFVSGDEFAIKLTNKENNKPFYFLRTVELNTSDNYHIIVVGKEPKPHKSLEKTIDFALKNDSLAIIDHPLVDARNIRKDITKEKQEHLKQVCKKYSKEITLEWNGYCIPWLRKSLLGGDVNKKLETFAEELESEGCNLPIVADTDVHARSKYLLNAIGTAYVETDIDTSSGKKMISSLKQNIFSNNYNNKKEYVSFQHFALACGLPVLFPNKYIRSRG